MNISALPEERLAPLGTSRVRLLRAAAPAESRTAGRTRLWGRPACTLTPLFGEIEWVWKWSERAPSRAQPKSGIQYYEAKLSLSLKDIKINPEVAGGSEGKRC